MVKENSCFESIFRQFLHLTLPSDLLGPLNSESMEFDFSRSICCTWSVKLSGNHLNSALRSPAGGHLLTEDAFLRYLVGDFMQDKGLTHPSGGSVHQAAIENLGKMR